MSKYAALAAENPSMAPKYMQMAREEYGDFETFRMSEFVKQSGLDVNMRACWMESDVMTTLLLVAIEFRRIDDIKVLLEMGADVKICDSEGYGALDWMFFGHDAYATQEWEMVEKVWGLLAPFNPPRDLAYVTLRDVVQCYEPSEILMKLVSECT